MTLLEHLLRHCFFHVAKGISSRPSCLNMIFLLSSFINCGFKKNVFFKAEFAGLIFIQFFLSEFLGEMLVLSVYCCQGP